MNKTATRILVVEDEADIRRLIVLHLEREGFVIDEASCGDEAIRLMESYEYPVLVIDWMLPGGGLSGIDLARINRDRLKPSSVLIVTAKAEPDDIVAGLGAGADDYLVKPFVPSVLVARVRTLLRRITSSPQPPSPKETIIKIGDFVMNTDSYEVKCNGEVVPLTPSEFKLLTTLIESRGRVLTREALIQQVQGEGISVVGRTVDTHVFGLRKKLGPCADIIETVRGVGYRVKAGD